MNLPAQNSVRLPIRVGSLLACLLLLLTVTSNASETRGNQFMGFDRFSNWTVQKGERRGEKIMISPEIVSRIAWNELVLSWNAEVPKNGYMIFEVRGIHLTGPTKWYNMGRWSVSANQPRESVLKQKDDQGDVDTDTLVLNKPAERFQVRITLGRDGLDIPRLKFIGVALVNSAFERAALPPNKLAWGRTIQVPERSQIPYPNGNVICSPTTVSMMLSYWSKRLNRPDLEHDVPETAEAVFDKNWNGTGNWAFNMAYAGSFKGMRAYVTRMSDVSELEDWVSAGIPVGLSLCYDLLRGRPSERSGHLVVCVGFTPEGDPIINDPGTSKNVRKVFPRKNLVKAWAYSRNAAYVVYSEDASVPKDRFGHWESWSSKKQIRTEPARFK